jgi:hypothetical protein
MNRFEVGPPRALLVHTRAEPEFRGKSIYLRNAGPESFYLSPQDEGEEFPPETTAQVRGGASVPRDDPAASCWHRAMAQTPSSLACR